MTAAICCSLGTLAMTPAKTGEILNPQISTAQISAQTYKPSLPEEAKAKLAPFNTIQDLAGEYEWSNTSLLSYSRPNSVEMVASDALVVDDKIQINLYLPYVTITSPLIATVDLEAGTFTIENMQELGYDKDGQVFFYLKDAIWNDETGEGEVLPGASDQASVTGIIQDNTITFPEKSIWAVGDPETEETVGAWIMTNNNVFIGGTQPVGDPNEGWTSIGMATLQDGWVLPRFKIDQTDPANWYQVELQQNDEDPNTYRLVDPYHGDFPAKEYNMCDQIGYIQFNVADPENVVFDAVEAGFANYGLLGISKFYCINQLRLWANVMEMEPSVVAEWGLSYTRFEDGIVILPTGNIDEDGWANDACFGIQGDPCGGMGWLNGLEPANMAAKIFFPGALNGVDEISKSDSAKTEYFDLQGMPLSSPSKGQLIIRKQGNKTSKILFR